VSLKIPTRLCTTLTVTAGLLFLDKKRPLTGGFTVIVAGFEYAQISAGLIRDGEEYVTVRLSCHISDNLWDSTKLPIFNLKKPGFQRFSLLRYLFFLPVKI
jgi:hypothetical protein